jgi:hypothetical protein
MALNWNSVRAEHVTRACELIGGEQGARARARGIVVEFGGQSLPAKEVLRVAYLLANNLKTTTPLRFTSGEGTIQRLQRLGFRAGRIQAKAGFPPPLGS